MPIAFRGFAPTDVRIKSQNDIGCPNAEVIQEVVSTQPTSKSETEFDCSLISDLHAKKALSILKWVPSETEHHGAQVQTTTEFDVPVGWIVHTSDGEYYGPYHVVPGIVLTLWSPDKCRPLP